MPLEAINISDNTVAQYQRDGAICLRGLFSQDWLDKLSVGIERNFSEFTDSPYQRNYTAAGNPGGFYDDYCNWQRIDEYRDFVLHSPAAQIAARLMQSDFARIYHEHVLIKEPGTRETTPWHHDQPYYGLDGNMLCSIWLPMEAVPQDVCLEFVAGSHAAGDLYYPRQFVSHENYADGEDGFQTVPDIEANRAAHKILSWELARGDCIAFHMRALHSAPATVNLKSRRAGFSVRWLGEDVRFATRPWTTSPPYPNLNLKAGDTMEHPEFPVVWKK